MTLSDLIKYFAKFPDRTGVLKTFSKTSSLVTGYASLKSDIEGLPAALIPAIKDFVVSTDEEAIHRMIRNAASYFMMVEYAGITSTSPNTAHVRNSTFNLSVIVAYPGNKKGFDMIEELLIMDQALEMVSTIARQMDTDNKELCSQLRFMPGGISIAPVEPAMLYGCIGWALTFTRNEPLFNA